MNKKQVKTPRRSWSSSIIFSLWVAIMLITGSMDGATAHPSLLPVLSAKSRIDGCPGVVQVGAAYLRAGPGRNYPSKGVVYKGKPLLVIGWNKANTWFKVQLTESSDIREGWIRAYLVAVEGTCSLLVIDPNTNAPQIESAPVTDSTTLTGPSAADESLLLTLTAPITASVTLTTTNAPVAGPPNLMRLTGWVASQWPLPLLYAAVPVVLLAGTLLFLGIRRRSTVRLRHGVNGPLNDAAPISAGLAGPPTAGTAYLETKIDATGAMLYYPLAQNVISIGRDPSNSIVLDQRFADLDGVSRQHAQIVRTGAVFIAKDLGSANGIWINQRRSRENVLRDGATLGIGKTQFIFRLNQPGGTV